MPAPAQRTHLFSWRPNGTLGAWKTLREGDRARTVKEVGSKRSLPPLTFPGTLPLLWAPTTQSSVTSRLSVPSAGTGSTGPRTPQHTHTAHCPPRLAYLGTWITLLSWGAGLSLGALEGTKARPLVGALGDRRVQHLSCHARRGMAEGNQALAPARLSTLTPTGGALCHFCQRPRQPRARSP